MRVKLDWQYDEEAEEVDWGAPDMAGLYDGGPGTAPASDRYERRPEHLRLGVSGRVTSFDSPGPFYLAAGVVLFALLVALYIFF